MAVSYGRYQRYSDCRDALDASLRSLVEEARREGWSYYEIAAALVNFAVDVVPDATAGGVPEKSLPSMSAH